MSSTIKAEVECDSCGGTGLYSGLMECKGEAVICVRCGGTGKQKLTFKKFEGRKKKRGINRIRSGSGMILDNSNNAKWITYDEFERLVPSK